MQPCSDWNQYSLRKKRKCTTVSLWPASCWLLQVIQCGHTHTHTHTYTHTHTHAHTHTYTHLSPSVLCLRVCVCLLNRYRTFSHLDYISARADAEKYLPTWLIMSFFSRRKVLSVKAFSRCWRTTCRPICPCLGFKFCIVSPPHTQTHNSLTFLPLHSTRVRTAPLGPVRCPDFQRSPKASYSQQITNFRKSVSRRKFYTPIQQLITDNPLLVCPTVPLAPPPLPSSPPPTSPPPLPY